MLAARDSGSTIRMAEFDSDTGRLEADAVIDLISQRTRWIAVTGSSNVIGSIPDVTSITRAAHKVGAKVAIDGVHLTPHRKVDIGEIGCDVYATSSYKWYGPHAGIMWIEPEVLNDLSVFQQLRRLRRYLKKLFDLLGVSEIHLIDLNPIDLFHLTFWLFGLVVFHSLLCRLSARRPVKVKIEMLLLYFLILLRR